MMGVLLLQFLDGDGRESLGLTGREEFSIRGSKTPRHARSPSARTARSSGRGCGWTLLRDKEYLRHGGILRYVLRRLLAVVTETGLRPFRRVRMGRVVLFVLLAVLAGLLAVSGTARTLGADGMPAPAAFKLADGSAGCLFDGERIACRTASMRLRSC